jgi:lipopolysaccharide export system permease protein
MKIINKYIKRQIYVDMVLLVTSLVGIIWLTQALRFIKDIVNKGLPMGTFFKITLTILPSPIALIIPFSIFAVILFVYNKMFADRELVVLKAVGMSDKQLAKPTFGAAIIFMFISALIYWWVYPMSARKLREMQWNFRNDLTNLLIKEGSFNYINKDVTFYIKEVDGEKIKGVFINDKRKANDDLTIVAKEGKLLNTSEGVNVFLSTGSLQNVNLKNNIATFASFDNYNMNMGILDKSNSSRKRDLQELHLTDIFNKNKPYYKNLKYRIEGHYRILAPLQVMIFAMLALIAVLKGGFDRRGQGKRLFKYTLFTVMIYTSNMGISSIAQKNERLIWVMYAYTFTLIIVALAMLLKSEKVTKSLRK